MWPFKPKCKHSWKTVGNIVFAGEVGVWLVKCTKCHRHGKQVTCKSLESCINSDPGRGRALRDWMEGNNTHSNIEDSK